MIVVGVLATIIIVLLIILGFQRQKETQKDPYQIPHITTTPEETQQSGPDEFDLIPDEQKNENLPDHSQHIDLTPTQNMPFYGKDKVGIKWDNTNALSEKERQELLNKAVTVNEDLFTYYSWQPRDYVEGTNPQRHFEKAWVLDEYRNEPYVSPTNTDPGRAWTIGDVQWGTVDSSTDTEALVRIEVSRMFYSNGEYVDENGHPYLLNHKGGTYSYLQKWIKKNGEWVLDALTENVK